MTRGRKRKTDDDTSTSSKPRRHSENESYPSVLDDTQETHQPDDEDELPVPAKYQPKPRSKPVEEPDPDDKDASAFHHAVEADQQDLTALLRQRMAAATAKAKEHRDDITAQVLGIFRESSAAHPATRGPKSLAAVAVFEDDVNAAAALVDRSHGLLHDYDDFCEKNERAVLVEERALLKVLVDEEARTRRMLEIGRKLTLRKVEKAFAKQEGSDEGVELEVGKGDGDGDAWKVVRENFRRVQKRARGERGGEGDVVSLVETVRYAERGVTRLAKGLPWEKIV